MIKRLNFKSKKIYNLVYNSFALLINITHRKRHSNVSVIIKNRFNLFDEKLKKKAAGNEIKNKRFSIFLYFLTGLFSKLFCIAGA